VPSPFRVLAAAKAISSEKPSSYLDLKRVKNSQTLSFTFGMGIGDENPASRSKFSSRIGVDIFVICDNCIFCCL
jgi:hypothetical protein